MKTIESQRSSLGPYWTFLVLTALQIKDNRHWPALRGLSSPPSTNTRKPWPSNGAKVPLEAYTGSKKSCHRNQTRGFGARPAVEYDSVMSQQSISGEILSLILCVWKPGFFKSGHTHTHTHTHIYICHNTLCNFTVTLSILGAFLGSVLINFEQSRVLFML